MSRDIFPIGYRDLRGSITVDSNPEGINQYTGGGNGTMEKRAHEISKYAKETASVNGKAPMSLKVLGASKAAETATQRVGSHSGVVGHVAASQAHTAAAEAHLRASGPMHVATAEQHRAMATQHSLMRK